jgi:hypothetical protein
MNPTDQPTHPVSTLESCPTTWPHLDPLPNSIFRFPQEPFKWRRRRRRRCHHRLAVVHRVGRVAEEYHAGGEPSVAHGRGDWWRGCARGCSSRRRRSWPSYQPRFPPPWSPQPAPAVPIPKIRSGSGRCGTWVSTSSSASSGSGRGTTDWFIFFSPDPDPACEDGTHGRQQLALPSLGRLTTAARVHMRDGKVRRRQSSAPPAARDELGHRRDGEQRQQAWASSARWEWRRVAHRQASPGSSGGGALLCRRSARMRPHSSPREVPTLYSNKQMKWSIPFPDSSSLALPSRYEHGELPLHYPRLGCLQWWAARSGGEKVLTSSALLRAANSGVFMAMMWQQCLVNESKEASKIFRGVMLMRRDRSRQYEKL